MNLTDLRERHVGETATLVGKGPSLLGLTADAFGPGPVMTLNHAILAIRRVRLPNVTYVMQKDGCVPSRPGRKPARVTCTCPNQRMVPPIAPEVLILSVANSAQCFRAYPHRVVIDVEHEFGIRWDSMSAAVAVRLLELMGCRSVRMLAMDAWTSGDIRVVEDGQRVTSGKRSYRAAGEQMADYAYAKGMTLEWL